MLRALVAALLLANLLFWAWSLGWLDGVAGSPAAGVHEPERMNRQVEPAAMHIVRQAPPPAGPPSSSASSAASGPGGAMATTGPVTCLESGPLTPEVAAQARTTLIEAGLPGLDAVRLTSLSRELPGSWIVYMGRFADNDAVGRKEAELQRLPGLSYDRLPDGSPLAPGLRLSAPAARADALRELAQLNQRGIRSAHVAALEPARREHRLRIEPVEPGLPARLAQQSAPALSALRFEACPPPEAAASGAPAAASSVASPASAAAPAAASVSSAASSPPSAAGTP